MSLGQIREAVNNFEKKYNTIFENTNMPKDKKDNLWKYLFATLLVPMRIQLNPEYDNLIKKDRAKKKRWDDPFDDFFSFKNFFYESILESFLNMQQRLREELLKPHDTISVSVDEAMVILDVDSRSDKTVINKAFKKKILEVHPDKGGTEEDAMRVYKAREILLNNI
jgi:hypothetical protein